MPMTYEGHGFDVDPKVYTSASIEKGKISGAFKDGACRGARRPGAPKGFRRKA